MCCSWNKQNYPIHCTLYICRLFTLNSTLYSSCSSNPQQPCKEKFQWRNLSPIIPYFNCRFRDNQTFQKRNEINRSVVSNSTSQLQPSVLLYKLCVACLIFSLIWKKKYIVGAIQIVATVVHTKLELSFLVLSMNCRFKNVSWQWCSGWSKIKVLIG